MNSLRASYSIHELCGSVTASPKRLNLAPLPQDPTLTCGARRNPLIRLAFRKITHHQQGGCMIFQNTIQTK